jgi:hypothetical protein
MGLLPARERLVNEFHGFSTDRGGSFSYRSASKRQFASKKVEQIQGCDVAKKGAAGLGGGRPPRTRSGDGEGWGRDRVRVTFCFRQCEAVAGAGRWSPSEIQRLGLDWDCRFTN